MNPSRLKTLFIFILAGTFLVSTTAPVKATSPTPTMTATKPANQATPAVSAQPKVPQTETEPLIFKKPTAKKSRPLTLKHLWLYDNLEHPTALLDYGKLNADLDPILSDQPRQPTGDEKFWGTVAGAAGYGIAGVAAAQSLGLLPNDRPKSKK